jgi:formiminotetrahydrofolate cyclodeaminase
LSYEKKSIEEFCELVASNQPAPGGGAVGGVVGALASALVEMVANLTVGKKKYEEWEAEMEEVIERMEAFRKKMYTILNRDIEVFTKVMECYKLPNTSDEEKAYRKEKLQDALKEAADVAFELCRLTSELSVDVIEVAKHGNKNLFSDAQAACELCRAAFNIGKANVNVNLKLIEDEEFKSNLLNELAELEAKIKYNLEVIEDFS